MTNYTEITGVVQDSDAQAWYKASWIARLKAPGNYPPSPMFKDGSGEVPTVFDGILGTDGSFASDTFIPDTSTIIPAGCRWEFTLQTLTSFPAQTFLFPLTGNTFDLGTYFSQYTVAPRIEASALVYAYNDAEVINPVNGSGYVNTITEAIFTWVNSGWIQVSGGSGDITPGDNFILPMYQPPSASTAVQPSLITSDSTGSNLAIPGYYSGTRFVTSPSGFINTYPQGGALQQSQNNVTIQGPGWSLGDFGGWSTGDSEYNQVFDATRGIHQMVAGSIDKHAVGDVAGFYSYVRSTGGSTAAADEGLSGINSRVVEYQLYFVGDVTATTGTGDTSPTLNYTGPNNTYNFTGDGSFLLNITKGTLAGTLNSAPTNLAGTNLNYYEVTGVTLPQSTAAGVWDTFVPWNNTTADVATSVSINVTLLDIDSELKPFVEGDHVSVAGNNYPEQSFITAVGEVVDGVQSITLALRNPNQGGVVFANGIAGQYVSLDTVLSVTAMRTSYWAFGSLTGTDLIAMGGVGGGLINIAFSPFSPATNTGANAGFHLYPGAEIVYNKNQFAEPVLEQNNVAWTVGDNVENPHFSGVGGASLWVTRTQNTLSPSITSVSVALFEADGFAFSGPAASGVRIINGNQDSMYLGFGGQMPQPGQALLVEGAFFCGINFELGPQTGAAGYPGLGNPALIRVGGTQSDTMRVFSFDYSEAGALDFIESLGLWQFDGGVSSTSAFYFGGSKGIGTSISDTIIIGTDGNSYTVAGGIVITETPNAGVAFSGLASGANDILVTSAAGAAEWVPLSSVVPSAPSITPSTPGNALNTLYTNGSSPVFINVTVEVSVIGTFSLQFLRGVDSGHLEPVSQFVVSSSVVNDTYTVQGWVPAEYVFEVVTGGTSTSTLVSWNTDTLG